MDTACDYNSRKNAPPASAFGLSRLQYRRVLKEWQCPHCGRQDPRSDEPKKPLLAHWGCYWAVPAEHRAATMLAWQDMQNAWLRGRGRLYKEMSFIDGVLYWFFSFFFKFRDIVKPEGDALVLYLRRFFLWRKDWMKDDRYFLHFIRRSDDDRALHDHPWDFTTLILKGGYVEHLPGALRIADFGTRLRNKAEHTHRLELEPGSTTWTILWVGRARRVWGFHTETGFVDWRTYLGLPTDFPDSPEDI